jgi:hypothetical protein
MRSRLTGQADYCRMRALEACRRICDPRLEDNAREQFREIASRWFALVRCYQQAEEVSGFLQWDAQRLEPPAAFEQIGRDVRLGTRAIPRQHHRTIRGRRHLLQSIRSKEGG